MLPCNPLPVFRLLLLIFLFPCILFAQDTTEVPQGVVVVKRTSVPASFRVETSWLYPESRGRSRISKADREEIVFSDSGQVMPILPPVPLNVESAPANLSDRELRKILQHNYPNGQYNWNGFYSDLDYKFSWDDTVRRDSARVQVLVDKNGKAVYKIIPWKNEDSTTIDLEQKLLKKSTTRPFWYTARENKRRKRKAHPLTAIGIITVYAYDPNMDRLMPIEVIPK